MIKNNVYYEFFASYTVPNPREVGYWVDLGANSKGKIIKVYNPSIKKWVKVTDATSEDAVSPFIGSNGNWWIDNRDTGIPAAGKNPYIEENGNWYIYDAIVAKDYIDTGISAKGLSAYDVAVSNGFQGTEEEWLESLKEPALAAAEIALAAAEGINESIDKVETAVSTAEQALEGAQQALESIEEAVENAEEVVTNPPKIVDGYWYTYNFETKEYENTNIRATGDSFKIAKTYTSVAEMMADYDTTDVEVGEFVWINTGDVEDPDDSKLYLKGETAWELVGDLSGQSGIQGQSAYEIAVYYGFVGTEEEWIQSLKQPALDAADEALTAKDEIIAVKEAIETAEQLRVEAEAARVSAENSRVEAESTRVSNETTRESNETTRQSNEVTRQSNEETRQANEAVREANEATRETQEAARQTSTTAAITAAETATNAANLAATEATTQANRAKEYADNPPKIEDDYWYVWDESTSAYVNTNVKAVGENGIQGETGATGEPGKSPIIQSGTWWVYDNDLEEYTNTGVAVSSDYVLTKEAVESVLTGDITSHTHEQYLTDAPSDGNQYVRQNGSWESVNISGSVSVDLSNYLAKDNTTEYTPVGDYNPATKKYVDDSIPDLSEINTAIAANTAAIENKVDKVDGKQLSTNDYTTEEKDKLAGIEAGAEVNVNADWDATEGDAQILNRPTLATVATTGSYDDLIDTPTIPTLDNVLTKDNTEEYTPTGDYNPSTKKYVDDEVSGLSTTVDQKINSAIASVYRVKGSVANYDSLPTEDVVIGDVYNVLDSGANYVAISTAPEWDKLSETVDVEALLTKVEAANTYQLKGDYITSIPDEYVTESELETILTTKDYATSTEVEDAIAEEIASLTIPTKTSELENDSGFITSIPDEYVTTTELEGYNYVTSTDVETALSDYVTEAPIDGKIYARKDSTWVEIDGSASASSVETLKVQVTSNQTQPDTNLYGATITVSYGAFTAVTDSNAAEMTAGTYVAFTANGTDYYGTIYQVVTSNASVHQIGVRSISDNTVLGILAYYYSDRVEFTPNVSGISYSYTVTDLKFSSSSSTQSLTWQGSELSFDIPAGYTYIVSGLDVEYYATPTSQLYTAELITRTAILTYNTTIVTFNVGLTNNVSTYIYECYPNLDTALYAANMTISSDDFEDIVVTHGQEHNIPLGSQCTVTFENLPGSTGTTAYYKTVAPASQTFTATGTNQTITGYYGGTCVQLTQLYGDERPESFEITLKKDSETVAVVTRDNSSDTTWFLLDDVSNTYTWEVTFSDVTNYNTPSSISLSGSGSTQFYTYEYEFLVEDIYAMWVEFDDSTSTTSLERGGNLDVITSLTSKFRRCLALPRYDGTAAITYLSDTNSSLYSDGTSVTDTTLGHTDFYMVHFPKYYYRMEETGDNKHRLYISERKINDNYKEENECLIAMFKAYVYDSCPYSVPGNPTYGATISNYYTWARQYGSNWGLIDYRAHKTIANLFCAKYGTTDISTQNESIPCSGGGPDGTDYAGRTITLGNADGISSITYGSCRSTSFLGIEDAYAYFGEWMQGINIVNDKYIVYDGGLYVGADAETLTQAGFTNVRTIGDVSSIGYGYITSVVHGEYADVLPIAIGGSSTTYYADGCNFVENDNFIVSRAHYPDDGFITAGNGVFTIFGYHSTTPYYSTVGTRLGFYGTIVEKTKDEFLALPIEHLSSTRDM